MEKNNEINHNGNINKSLIIDMKNDKDIKDTDRHCNSQSLSWMLKCNSEWKAETIEIYKKSDRICFKNTISRQIYK